jgi:hypothetical protein
MKRIKFSKRVDFTYFIGAGISLILLNIAMFYYKNSGLPMIFSLISFLTYCGVIIRGILDRKSWGKTPMQIKVSAFIGFTSIFFISSIESVLLLTRSFELSKNEIKSILLYGGTGIILLYLLLYIFWFRKLTYLENENS